MHDISLFFQRHQQITRRNIKLICRRKQLNSSGTNNNTRKEHLINLAGWDKLFRSEPWVGEAIFTYSALDIIV